MMKLYLATYAPNPRRVAMFLAEKGISDIPVVMLDLPKGEHRDADFRKLSPLAQVPTLLLDNGRTLTESRAICTYLESLYPEPNLLGRDGFERAEIEMWDRRAELMITMPMMMWVRHGSPVLAKVEKNQNAAVADYYRDVALHTAQWLNSELAFRDFVAGDRLTNADLTLLAGMDFAKMMRWRPGDDLPHLARWRAMMAERPAGQTPP
jgi:glutathione S-transferase